MIFKTYKVKQGQYKEIKDSTIVIPAETQLITGGPNDVGKGLHSGLCHYFGIVKGDYNEILDLCKGLHVYVYKFLDLNIISILDISFIDEHPEILSAQEFNAKYDLSQYYIVNYSDKFVIESMYNIQNITSEFNVTANCAYNVNWAGKPSKVLEILQTEFCNLYHGYSFHGFVKIVKGDIASMYYDTIVAQVLEGFGILFSGQKRVNLNLANELYKEERYDELTDVINMKKLEQKNL